MRNQDGLQHIVLLAGLTALPMALLACESDGHFDYGGACFTPGLTGTLPAIAVDGSGDLYLAGARLEGPEPFGWVVRKLRLTTDDGGERKDLADAPWVTVDELPPEELGTHGGGAGAIATDASKRIFVSGSNGLGEWIVRMSPDRGRTWSTVDRFKHEGLRTGATDLRISQNDGRVLVSGMASQGIETWNILRESLDSGATWTTLEVRKHGEYYASLLPLWDPVTRTSYRFRKVLETTINRHNHYEATDRWVVEEFRDELTRWREVDRYHYDFYRQTWPKALHLTVSGVLIVTGFGMASDGTHGLIRRSGDRGQTWATVDDYLHKTCSNTYTNSATSTPDGTIYAAGGGMAEADNYFWYVRRSTDDGRSWDEFARDYPGKR